MEVLKRFASFIYARHLYTDGRIILVDEPLLPEIRERLLALKTLDDTELTLLDDRELADDLEGLLREAVQQEERILLVFPGNGANYPRVLSEVCQQLPGTSVYAKRFWTPGTDPVAIVGTILPEVFLVVGVRTIFVVDDVISSGQTLYRLHRSNAWKFPRARWVGACWVAQVPQMRAQSGVNGYERIITARVIEGPNKRKVPINSLSTLRKESAIAKNYARRHFDDPRAFLRLINS